MRQMLAANLFNSSTQNMWFTKTIKMVLLSMSLNMVADALTEKRRYFMEQMLVVIYVCSNKLQGEAVESKCGNKVDSINTVTVQVWLLELLISLQLQNFIKPFF